jgi:hypothetical protein
MSLGCARIEAICISLSKGLPFPRQIFYKGTILREIILTIYIYKTRFQQKKLQALKTTWLVVSLNMIITSKTKRIGTISLLMATALVTASLASIGMIQANNAAAAAQVFRTTIKDSSVLLDKTIQEGNIQTQASVFAVTSKSDEDTFLCLAYSQIDTSTQTEFVSFFNCGSPDQFTVSGNLDSATTSGTITGIEDVSGKEITVTVNADLTANGKAKTFGGATVENGFRYTIVERASGRSVDASGSLDIEGDITFSTDDATGFIINSRTGAMVVQRA